MDDKVIFVFVLFVSGLSIIEARPNDDESVTGKAGLLHRDILGIYDRNVGVLLAPQTPARPEDMEVLIRDTRDRLIDEYAKISAIALAEYYGTAVLKQECNEEPPPGIPAEKLRITRLICEENNKRINPNVEEKIDTEMAKVIMREMLKRFTIAEMKEGCKSIDSGKQLNLPPLDRAWIQRVCVETNKQ